MAEDFDLPQTRAAAVMLLHSLARRLLLCTVVEPISQAPAAAGESRQLTLYDLVIEFEKILANIAERQQPSGEICCVCGQPASWRVQANAVAEFCSCERCLNLTKAAAGYLFREAEITVAACTVRNAGGSTPCPP